MENFLFDPNVAYVLLSAGVLLGLLAIVTPGTGLPELGAFFCLALAGFAIYNRGGLNPWALILLVLSVLPFYFSIRKPGRGLWLILSILGLGIGSVYLFPSEGLRPAVNPFIAVAVSLFMGGFLWLAARKTLQVMQLRPMHDLTVLVGQVGEAKTRVHEDGSVQVAGELWSARSGKPIPAGSPIRVVSRNGFVLDVTAESDKGEK
jgi:membrane-bound serine protease (ClpP class)